VIEEPQQRGKPGACHWHTPQRRLHLFRNLHLDRKLACWHFLQDGSTYVHL
jgi:hypothetical protein